MFRNGTKLGVTTNVEVGIILSKYQPTAMLILNFSGARSFLLDTKAEYIGDLVSIKWNKVIESRFVL